MYRPLQSLFPHAERLLLRASVRTRHSQSFYRGVEEVVLDTLVRDGRGMFRGTFVLPDSVVFAFMAVEDFEASVVDDRTDRPWEVMLFGSDGKPTFDALEQRENAYVGVSWEEAYATARRRAELYPNQIRSWGALEFFEGEVLDKAAADSAAAARLPRIEALVAAYRAAPSIPLEELAQLTYRAYAQEDTAAWNYWWERLRREAPRNPETVTHATLRALRKYPWVDGKWDERMLVDIEKIWEQHGPVTEAGNIIFQVGIQISRQKNDASAYRRWTHRQMAGTPSLVRHNASNFLKYPELREEGLIILREQLAVIHRDVRGLGVTRAAHARGTAAKRRRLFAAIGRGLLDAGNQRGGLDTLALAVGDGWDHALFLDVADARMNAGDTVGAIVIEAKIAADPRTTEAHRDSMATIAERVLGANAWRDAVADAKVFMAKATMASAVLRHVTGEPQLTDSAGRVIRLRDLIAGGPALVVFWSRFCGPALAALPRIDSVATVLRGQGVPAFLIVDEPPSAALSAFLKEHKVSTPVYHELRREASKSFRNFGTPAYYVLDPAGRIRFTWAPTENDLLVQVAAVRDEPTPVTRERGPD
ncbi:MAG: TlpA disulfide reductase family protein [Gemmatimonadaceae bacterium]